ncbi:hypothetical protein QY049_05425 [Bradyrhizobium sp. WYCCWR 13022]|uniref:hypothetical protein n=1 Tax=unclassified Bradyrhizobium TaxID=2631580 RepID=UPI00263ABB68|nr:hypothetical protein [Bradyrhizobium sp. WYCCWR 13022]MDN4982667.1 hypothetical protein [Bradyrhizobium sp. WYCCWR 13022]
MLLRVRDGVTRAVRRILVLLHDRSVIPSKARHHRDPLPRDHRRLRLPAPTAICLASTCQAFIQTGEQR